MCAKFSPLSKRCETTGKKHGRSASSSAAGPNSIRSGRRLRAKSSGRIVSQLGADQCSRRLGRTRYRCGDGVGRATCRRASSAIKPCKQLFPRWPIKIRRPRSTFLQNLPPGRKRQNLYWPIFSRWTTTDPLAAAQRAAQLPAGSKSRHSLAGHRLELGESGSGGGFCLGKYFAAGQGRNNALQNIFASWASKDPQKAAAMVDSVAGRFTRAIKPSATSRGNGRTTDARAALAWTRAIAGERCATKCLEQCARDLGAIGTSRGGRNMSRTCRRANTGKSDHGDRDAIGQQRCAKRDRLGAKTSRWSGESKTRSSILFRNGREADPQAAADFALRMSRRRWTQQFTRKYFATMGASLMRKPRFRGRAVCRAQSRDSVLPGIIASVAETDLPEATRLVAQLSDGRCASQCRPARLPGNGPARSAGRQ